MTPFKSKFKITQAFGINADYYKQFGLKGHEGIDLIPTGSVWDVLCLYDGVVVNETDNPRSGAYGIWITIWSPTIKKAFQYCHLKENYVSAGDKVTAGQKLGVMGNTGNSTGPHLHLNVFEVDDNGIRLNKNNGFNGGIDPLPLLSNEEQPTDNTVELDKCRVSRDSHWNDLMKIKDALTVQGEYSIDNILNRIDSLSKSEMTLGDKDKQLNDVQSQLSSISLQLKNKIDEYIALQAKNEELHKEIETQAKSIEEFGIAMHEARSDIERLRAIKETDQLTALEHLVKFFVKLFVNKK